MDWLGRRHMHTESLYGACFPKSCLVVIRADMDFMEAVDTVCHELYHATVCHEVYEEQQALEHGTACADVLRQLGFLACD